MPNMKYKSDENLKAADLLIKNSLYTASVHCLYYSSFQLSKYLLDVKYGISYSMQDYKSKGIDSHIYIINEVVDKIGFDCRFDGLDYKLFIGKLKMLRKRADYSIDVILEKEAIKAYQYADDVLKILTKKLTA